MFNTRYAPPINILWSAPANRGVRTFVLIAAGVLLLTLSAKIQVPFYPVPMTFQTFVVLVLGMTYGVRLGGATALSYIAVGALGLPVFAGTPEKGIGLAYMVGPTGGYILGFLLATTICGWLVQRGWGQNFFTTAAAMLIGNIAIYIPGLLWLGSVIGWDKPVLTFGLYPFIFADIFKLTLAAIILPQAMKFTRRIQHKRDGQ